MQCEICGSNWRLALSRESQFDEKRAEDGLNEREGNRRNGGRTREMAADGAGERPHQQSDGRKERDAACDAMCELDDGVGAGRVLQDSAVAQRPVVAAASAGARGTHQGSPENYGD